MKRLSFKYAQIYWEKTNKGFVANDIKSNLKYDLGIDTTEQYLRKLMKQNLGISYKKGPSRPLEYESNKSKIVKKLFAIEFSHILRSDYLFINIDEVLFSNKTKHSYSWMPKGKSSKIEKLLLKDLDL